MQHLASSGKHGFVHAWGTGTEDEKGEVQMGTERAEKEPGDRITVGLSRAELPAKGQHEAGRAGTEGKS